MMVYDTLHSAFDPSEVESLGTCPPAATDSDVGFLEVRVNNRNLTNIITSLVPSNTILRLRIVNSASMTNFHLDFGMTGTIIAVDGHWTKPFTTQKFWIAVAQRVDVLLQVPVNGFPEQGLYVSSLSESYEASLAAGMIFYTAAPPRPVQRPLVMPPVNAFMNFSYERQLSALIPLVPKPADRILTVNLTGDNGFMSINNHSYQLYPMVPLPVPNNPYPLQVKEGERVHIVINNHNPDPHAMHLHGHVFQVIEIDGEMISGALRDTVLVPGGCHTAVIAFDANNPGIHPFHCHMQWHMMAGMLTTVEYIV